MHIELRLDPQYDYALGIANKLFLRGELLLELVCSTKSDFATRVGACVDYTNRIPLPQKGDHITVIGQHVLDITHGWNEIHPVYAIAVDALETNR